MIFAQNIINIILKTYYYNKLITTFYLEFEIAI